jgi:hypothetical protein
VRTQEKYKLVESLGVRAVLGTLEDAPILAAEAEKADVVIHTADSADHLPACKAILEGMKRRSDNPILIHIVSVEVIRSFWSIFERGIERNGCADGRRARRTQ